MSAINPPSAKLIGAYGEAVLLWHASRVEHHAEGHPGITGPVGGDPIPWDQTDAYLDGIIKILRTIRERMTAR